MYVMKYYSTIGFIINLAKRDLDLIKAKSAILIMTALKIEAKISIKKA